jgi:hypothetical protein
MTSQLSSRMRAWRTDYLLTGCTTSLPSTASLKRNHQRTNEVVPYGAEISATDHAAGISTETGCVLRGVVVEHSDSASISEPERMDVLIQRAAVIQRSARTNIISFSGFGCYCRHEQMLLPPQPPTPVIPLEKQRRNGRQYVYHIRRRLRS